MFQSVIEQQGWRSGRFGAGMGISTLVHAALVASALVFSTQQAEEPPKEPELVWQVPVQPPKGYAVTPSTATQPKTQKPRPKKELVQPREVKPAVAEPVNKEPPPPDEAPDEPEEPLEGVPGGHPDGVLTGGVLGAAYIPDLTGKIGGTATGEDVLPFGTGMTRPELMSGGTLQYTREALEARVQGMIIAKCTITREGEVKNCRIIKGLPHMEEAVLSSLTARRYRPVTFQGRPVSVSYTFNVRLEIP